MWFLRSVSLQQDTVEEEDRQGSALLEVYTRSLDVWRVWIRLGHFQDGKISACIGSGKPDIAHPLPWAHSSHDHCDMEISSFLSFCFCSHSSLCLSELSSSLSATSCSVLRMQPGVVSDVMRFPTPLLSSQPGARVSCESSRSGTPPAPGTLGPLRQDVGLPRPVSHTVSGHRQCPLSGGTCDAPCSSIVLWMASSSFLSSGLWFLTLHYWL